MKIEDFPEIDPIYAKIYYFEHDTHYYLSDWEPKNKGYHFISGINFSGMPGRTPMIQNEGTIKISSNRGHYMVRMNTNGNGQVYSHPATYVPFPSRTINCGHYQFFATQVSSAKRTVEKLAGPDFNTEKSYFFSVLHRLICSLTNVTLATL